MHKEEIQAAELSHYSAELQQTVDAVCKSPSFRTSPKSCEFLRHIVYQTLSGNTDELKERLIGIALLGREATYDTGSDAGVRVRANDVRKRLSAYHSANEDQADFTFDLPTGSYIPRFFRNVVPAAPEATLPVEQEQVPAPMAPPPPAPLSLQQLALPTLIALFLCTICLRWQLTQEHPFTAFWQSVLQDHHAMLYVPPAQSDGKRELIDIEKMEVAAPLFNLAGQFHTRLPLSRTLTPPMSAEDILVSIGTGTADESASDHARLSGNRFVIEDTTAGREIVDLSAGGAHAPVFGSGGSAGRAALLTITNGARRSIQIDGTDEAAIGSLIQTLCERNSFPEELSDSFRSGTITQVVFPMAPHAEALVFHEQLQMTNSASVHFP